MKLILTLLKSLFKSLMYLPEKFNDEIASIIHDICVEISTSRIIGIIKNCFLRKEKKVHTIDMQKSADNFVHHITNGEFQNNENMQRYLKSIPSFETEEELIITADEIKYKKKTKGNKSL